MKLQHFWLGSLIAILVVFNSFYQPAQAQFPLFPNFSQNSSNFLNQSSDPVVAECIRLDGRCVMQIAANQSSLSSRITEIEQRLNDIAGYYLQNPSAEVEVRQEGVGSLVDIYVSVDDREIRLLSVTSQDATFKGMSIEQRSMQMVREVKSSLRQAKQEREPSFLIAQGQKAIIVLVLLIGLTIGLSVLENRSHQQKVSLHADLENTSEQPISSQINQNQRKQLVEIKYRLVQIVRFGLWLGGILYWVGLFPYTRFLQVLIVDVLRIPLRLILVAVGIYFLTRLSFVFIDKFTAALANNYLLTPEANLRLQLRISTISSVAKSIVVVSWTVVGILVGLSVIGVNIAPLLAGAGLIGVAISLASQNLIRDAINGFFIILEDQYAVGDVVSIGEATGFVEAINLRITQLRDTEGRLVTIPNSEIRTVTNYTSNWSQVDLKIPIAYHSDVEKAISLIQKINEEIMLDRSWRKNILEKPLLLGVDDFNPQGVILRVWIKTKPLQQWPIGREYRRRVKLAFDRAGIDLSLPQQQIWLNEKNLDFPH